MRQKPIKVVGAVILNKNRQSFFVGQRSRFAKLPLKWEFIGGKVQDGEDFLRATEREFKEEIGLEVKAKKVVDKTKFNYGGEVGEVEVYFVECENFQGSPEIDKNVYEKVGWIAKKKLLGLVWLEADLEFVQRLIAQNS